MGSSGMAGLAWSWSKSIAGAFIAIVSVVRLQRATIRISLGRKQKDQTEGKRPDESVADPLIEALCYFYS